MALPQPVDQLSLTTLREMLIEIGAKVVRHGRYITFQMADVAIPRPLFTEILQRIDGLRPAGHLRFWRRASVSCPDRDRRRRR